MKVYLEKGHSMRANLRIYPYKLQHFSTTDNSTPEAVSTQSHTLRIFGDADEVIDIEGSLSELQELVKLMSDVMDIVKE